MNLKLLRRKFKASYWVVTNKIAAMLNFGSNLLRSIISSLISNYFFNIIFFPVFGYSMLINYMAVNDFFSYEIISDSLFAVNLFIMTMIAGLMITTVAVFGSLVLLMSNYVGNKRNKTPFSSYWFLAVINFMMAFIVFYPVVSSEDKSFPIFVLLICMYLALHYSVFLFGKFKLKVLSLFFLFVLAIGVTFTAQDLSARVFANGLKAFQVGGSVKMKLYDEVEPKGEEVEVLLITPKAVYYKKDGATGLVPFDKVKKLIEVKN